MKQNRTLALLAEYTVKSPSCCFAVAGGRCRAAFTDQYKKTGPASSFLRRRPDLGDRIEAVRLAVRRGSVAIQCVKLVTNLQNILQLVMSNIRAKPVARAERQTCCQYARTWGKRHAFGTFWVMLAPLCITQNGLTNSIFLLH